SFFFTASPLAEIYTLSLHDALPISPPISAPEVPILTLAIPQSDPATERNASASLIFVVMIAEESPWGTSFWITIASSIDLYLIRSEERRVGKECRSSGLPEH